MPIKHSPKAPGRGLRIAVENTTELLKDMPAHSSRLKAKGLSASHPHLAYCVGLDDLLSGHLLATAKPFAWRYLITDQSNEVAEVALTPTELADPEFLSISEGPLAPATLRVLQKSEALSSLKAKDYEPRFLEIPSVHFAAVWLHHKEDNIIIPLVRAPKGLSVEVPYSESQILEALLPLAKAVNA